MTIKSPARCYRSSLRGNREQRKRRLRGGETELMPKEGVKQAEGKQALQNRFAHGVRIRWEAPFD